MMTGVVESLLRKYLLPSMPGFAVRKKLLFRDPVNLVLRGYYFEDSGFDPQSFTVWAFAQPLYVPRRELVFNLGGRLGTLSGGQERWWKLAQMKEAEAMAEVGELIQREAEPRLGHLQDPESLLRALEEGLGDPRNPSWKEVLAYSRALAGKKTAALAALDDLDRLIPQQQFSAEWKQETLERSSDLRAALEQGVEPARRLLEQWASETAAALGLSRVAEAPRSPKSRTHARA